MENKQQYPVFKSDVLLTHPSTPTRTYMTFVTLLQSQRALSLEPNICRFGALAEMTEAVILFGKSLMRDKANLYNFHVQ